MSLGATKYIGARIARREDTRFLTGRTHYVDDIRLPRTVHAAFVRSPYAHAEVQAMRTDRAAGHHGVVGILTGEEAARLSRPIRGDSEWPGWKGTDFPVLGWPRIHFVGQAVAVVAAVDRYIAEDAAELVEVDYRPLAVVVDLESAAEAGGPLVHEAWGDNLFLDRQGRFGDVDAAFGRADLIWQRAYRTHRHTGFPMEGRACIADYDPATGVLTLYSATQMPHLLRTGLADTLGLGEHHIRVIAPDVGGGFGIKSHLFPEEVAVCLLAMRLGRPVKWIEDTFEHLAASIHAREHVHRVQVAVKRDGTILGLKADVLVDAGAYSVWPWTAAMEVGMAVNMIPGPYRIGAYEFRARTVATNKCPLGPYRGVARSSAAFTIERVMDDIARELGLDPVAIRFKNYVPDDAYPYTSITGFVYDSASLQASLHKLTDAIGYADFRREQAAARSEGRYLGIGIGTFIEQTAHGTSEFVRRRNPIVFGYDTVSLSVDPSGKVTVASGLHSHGQGHETTVAQVVAERLGVPLADIRVRFGDTESAPYGLGTFASRSAVYGGGAAWKAAEKVRHNLLAMAAHMMEANPDDLEIAEGIIQVRGSPRSRMTVAEVARLAYHRPERLPPGLMPADLSTTQNYDAAPGTGTWANAAHAAIVDVDIATGFVRILRYVVVEDCGAMINPLIVDGQVHGGAVQGIGGAMMEHLVYDENGQLRSQTLMEYLLPSALDVPTIEVHHLQTPSPFTLGGFKGMGEGGAIAPLPALANAVSDALAPLGISIDALPLSPERIRRLIEPREAQP
ncbi:MAG TPA: xanthine dehydrogenase family protein molybdopterin-binding subunit [Candidatus Tectomicrobia bacterium]|nr:xanthine dehydrogenase family protein molybdopterin-binding subunit [Candidatus Tectomicrobia bacterium]